jgi:3-oxoacyl-[acyl-carrier protein] reductase
LRSGAIQTAKQQGREVDEVLAERAKATPAGRVGDPAEFGDACVFLCAASSGFIVGQNLLLDGGAFNSSMS